MEQPKQYTPEEIAELEKSRTISDAKLLKGDGGMRKIILTIVSIFAYSIGFIIISINSDAYYGNEYSVLLAILLFAILQVALVYYKVYYKGRQWPLSLLIFAILLALFGKGSDGSLWIGSISMIISTIFIFNTYVSGTNLSPKLKLAFKIIGIPILILISVLATLQISVLGGARYSFH